MHLYFLEINTTKLCILKVNIFFFQKTIVKINLKVVHLLTFFYDKFPYSYSSVTFKKPYKFLRVQNKNI